MRAQLESRLATMGNHAEAVLFGQARSALAALLEVTKEPGSTIVLPATVCPVVYAVFWAARVDVQLADVDINTGLSGDRLMFEAMRRTGKAALVMPTHLYGFWSSYPLTTKQAAEDASLLVENDAYATTFSASYAPLARMTLVSFGPGKPLDAGEGGALLLDDAGLARELRRVEQSYPPHSAGDRAEESRLSERKRALRNAPAGSRPSGSFEELLPKETKSLRRGFNDAAGAALNNALGGFADNVRRRQARLAQWRRELSSCADLIRWPSTEPAVPWRAIVRVPDHRDRVVADLRAAGFDAGTNFPSLAGTYRSLSSASCHGAAVWEREVMNLWVTDDYPPERIGAASVVVRKSLGC